MDVLGTEKKILSFVYDMRHVVIRTIASVTDKDIPGIRQSPAPVNRIAEIPEFILLADGLDEGIRISMFLQVIKGIQMHAAEAFCRAAF